MGGYGQYCPIARGAEIFAERWTPLIVRNLHLGARTFSDIHQGVPRMSRTLLGGWKNLLRQSRLPARRVVIRFDVRDRPVHRYWLLLQRGSVELCVKPPDLVEDLVIAVTADALAQVHMGRLTIPEATARGEWSMEGDPRVARAFPTWGGLSRFAGVARATFSG